MPASTEIPLDNAIRDREAGRLEESRAILENLVAQNIHRFGRKSYESQCAMSQLGRTLRAMGRAEEAGALHWEVLAIRTEAYGRRGQYTVNSAGILADTLRNYLHDKFMAAAVEGWSAESEQAVEPFPRGKPLTVDELQQAVRQRESAATQMVAGLIDEYLQRPLSERHLQRSG